MKKKRRPTVNRRKGATPSATGHYLKILFAALALALVIGAAAVVALFFLPDAGERRASRPSPAPARTATRSKAPAPAQTAAKRPVFEVYPEKDRPPSPAPCGPGPATAARPKVALIIDDMGYDRDLATRFAALGIPLTFSVLPYSPHGEEIARAAREKNIEIMLHLPMEPDEYPAVDPGRGVLLTAMSPDALIAELEADIRAVPWAAGVNNHMGSKLTTVSTQMYQVFSVLKKHNLFFIDSRTTPDSQCRPSARLLQVPFAERDVFLDNSPAVADIEARIDETIALARRNGRAIAIGHAHASTCRAIENRLKVLQQQVETVPASHLVCRVPR
ncbi:MAG: divergent polysaccharide deacetylase family protein [Thermodesulfobacteriota bacterium]